MSLRVMRGSALWRTTAYATQGRWQLFLTIPPAGGRFEGTGSQTEENDSRTGFGATTALTMPLARGEFTIGGETRLDNSDFSNHFTTNRVRDSVAEIVSGQQVLGAPFVQSTWNLTDRLRVDLGARFDVLRTRSTTGGVSTSAAHGVFSPKTGAIFQANPNLAVYANASHGFRSADGVIADPTLVPISAWSFETGLKVDRGRFGASVGVFRTNVSNEQTFNPVTLEAFNGGASRRQGVEADWRMMLRPAVTFTGDWSFNDARYRTITLEPEGGGPPEQLDGLRVYNTSRYLGTTAIDISPAGAAWRLRASGNWVGPYSPFDEPGVVLGGYGLAHMAASWRFRAVTLELGVRNVLDRAYPEVVAGGIVAPGEPRTLSLGLRARVD